MDTAQWPLQERIMKPMEEMKNGTCSSLERKVGITRGIRGNEKEEAGGGLKKGCPRCNSTNTKFCYYNNYSLTQPRYFCKTCKRYWTEGGTLRNIPVGGASRKNTKRSAACATSSVGRNNITYNNNIIIPSSSTTTPATSSTTTSSVLVHQLSSKKNNLNILDLKNAKIIHEEALPDQDLNLGFNNIGRQDDFKTISELIQVPNFFERKESSSSSNQHQQLSALEMITGINSFFPLMPIATSDPAAAAAAEVYSNGYSQLLLPLDYNKQSLSFSLEAGFGNGGYIGNLQEDTNGGRLLFPFEDLKMQAVSAAAGTTTSTTDFQLNNRDDENNNNGDSNGYWNGVIGGGSW